jgi:hypothetical protein
VGLTKQRHELLARELDSLSRAVPSASPSLAHRKML